MHERKKWNWHLTIALLVGGIATVCFHYALGWDADIRSSAWDEYHAQTEVRIAYYQALRQREGEEAIAGLRSVDEIKDRQVKEFVRNVRILHFKDPANSEQYLAASHDVFDRGFAPINNLNRSETLGNRYNAEGITFQPYKLVEDPKIFKRVLEGDASAMTKVPPKPENLLPRPDILQPKDIGLYSIVIWTMTSVFAFMLLRIFRRRPN